MIILSYVVQEFKLISKSLSVLALKGGRAVLKQITALRLLSLFELDNI